MIKTKILPGLNGIRAIAALSVVIHHIEGFKAKANLPNLTNIDIVQAVGPQGVKAFFVLSGFLITHLLLLEKSNAEKIDILNFYMRRVLRIWPLYFLVITISLILYYGGMSPWYFKQTFDTYLIVKLLLLILLLPNLLLYIFGSIHGVGVLWSVGAEEQFYLFWPHLINKYKSLLQKFAFLIIAMIFLRVVCYLGMGYFEKDLVVGKLFRAGYYIFIFDSMVIGAVGAYLLYKKSAFLKCLYSTKVQLSSIVLLLALLFINFRVPVIDNILWSVVFVVLILNIASNTNTIVRLNGRTLNWLGKISYGIYMYHSFAISLMLYFLSSLIEPSFGVFHLFLYIGSIVLTIVFAHVSYNYFERPILRLKERYTVIHVSP